MNKAACCFTGHRTIPMGKIADLYAQLLHEINTLTDEDCLNFYAGGALGFDTLAAQAVLQAREQRPAIRLHLVLPCPEQHLHWHSNQQHIYETILSQANSITYAAEMYSQQAIWLRNRMLVDYSQTCLCYLTRAKGGTAYTVRYARQKGLSLKNLAEYSPHDDLNNSGQTKLLSV